MAWTSAACAVDALLECLGSLHRPKPCSAVTAVSMHLVSSPSPERQPKGLRQLCVATVQYFRRFLMMQKPVNRLTIAVVSKSDPARPSPDFSYCSCSCLRSNYAKHSSSRESSILACRSLPSLTSSIPFSPPLRVCVPFLRGPDIRALGHKRQRCLILHRPALWTVRPHRIQDGLLKVTHAMAVRSQ